MDWNVVAASLSSLAGVVVGVLLTLYTHRNQQARDQAERLAEGRREWVTPLQRALGELVALVIRQVPEICAALAKAAERGLTANYTRAEVNRADQAIRYARKRRVPWACKTFKSPNQHLRANNNLTPQGDRP